jgi:hypothetical protein
LGRTSPHFPAFSAGSVDFPIAIITFATAQPVAAPLSLISKSWIFDFSDFRINFLVFGETFSEKLFRRNYFFFGETFLDSGFQIPDFFFGLFSAIFSEIFRKFFGLLDQFWVIFFLVFCSAKTSKDPTN